MQRLSTTNNLLLRALVSNRVWTSVLRCSEFCAVKVTTDALG